MTLICFSHCIAQTNRNFICLEKAKNVDNVLEILKILNILEFQFVFAVSSFVLFTYCFFLNTLGKHTESRGKGYESSTQKNRMCEKKEKK